MLYNGPHSSLTPGIPLVILGLCLRCCCFAFILGIFFNFETWLSFLMILVPQNSETSFTLFATCIMIYCLTSRDKIKSVLLINHFHPKFIPSTVNIKKKACFKEYLNRKINLNENVLF